MRLLRGIETYKNIGNHSCSSPHILLVSSQKYSCSNVYVCCTLDSCCSHMLNFNREYVSLCINKSLGSAISCTPAALQNQALVTPDMK